MTKNLMRAVQAMQASLKAYSVNTQGLQAQPLVPAAQTAAAKTAQATAALLKEAGWSISGVSKVEPMFSAILGMAKAWPPTVSFPGEVQSELYRFRL
jgi:hypothetical protein